VLSRSFAPAHNNMSHKMWSPYCSGVVEYHTTTVLSVVYGMFGSMQMG